MGTVFGTKWASKPSQISNTFLKDVSGELGRPHTQSAAAGWLQTQVGTLLKKSEFRQMLYHFELQKCTDIDPGHLKTPLRKHLKKRHTTNTQKKPVLAREREARFKKESLPNMFSTVMWT